MHRVCIHEYIVTHAHRIFAVQCKQNKQFSINKYAGWLDARATDDDVLKLAQILGNAYEASAEIELATVIRKKVSVCVCNSCKQVPM